MKSVHVITAKAKDGKYYLASQRKFETHIQAERWMEKMYDHYGREDVTFRVEQWWNDE